MSLRLVLSSLVFLFITLLTACSESPPPVLPAKPDIVVVQVKTLAAEQWSRSFTAYGSVKPAEEVDISVDVAATVKEVRFDEGDKVKAGDVLLVLDAKKIQLQLSSAKASVAEARAQLEQASANFERDKSIYQQGVISQRAFQQSEVDLKASKANLQRAIASYDLARQDLKDTSIYSPVDGVITRRNVEPGKNVTAASSLGTIRGQGVLRVETYISEKDVNAISKGQGVTVRSSGVPGQIYQGRVESIAVTADEATGNFRLRIAVANDNGLLKEGMSARVRLEGITQNNVMLIPRNAVVDRNRRQLVFTINDGKAVANEPVIGIGSGDSVPVLDGLSEGAQVIVSNLHLISAGQAVQVKSDNAAADEAQ